MPEDAVGPPTARAETGRGFELLLLLSGFCGISYEILYGRILSNVIGDQFAVSASILLTFLLGIGIGALYAHRLWRFLWLIEGGIGGCAVLVVLSVPLLDRWAYFGARPGGGLAAAMLVCFVVLTVPAFFIGCSLPLFAGYLSRTSSSRAFSRAYTLYNFGAAATALVIEFWLLRLLGIRHTVFAIAAINAAVSLTLLLRFRHLRDRPAEPPPPIRFPRRTLAALAIASVGSAVFQLLMIKLGECLLGPFRETFALVLAIVLLGIAVGSALSRLRQVEFRRLMLLGLGSLAWLMGGFGWVARAYAVWHPSTVDSHLLIVLLKFATLILLMGPAAVAFGATIPALLAEQGDVARESGELLFVSSVANAAGFLLMAFVLHRYFDYGILILIVAGMTTLAALTYAGARDRVAITCVVVLAGTVALHRVRWNENLLYLGYTSFQSPGDLKSALGDIQFPERFKGAQDVFSLTRTRGNVQFFINGFISISLNSPAEKVVGAFSALFAPRTDRALVLGLGSGATAGTVALLFDRTDIIEINPVVVQNLFRMKAYNFDIEARPNTRIIVDDGIHFTKVSPERYSLIVNTVTTPLYFSSSKLYTRDFLESVRRVLTPDGVYVTWIDSRVGDRGIDIILKTLSQSFTSCWIGAIKTSYFLLLCSEAPMGVRRPGLVAANPTLNDYFFRENGLRPEWFPYGLLSTRVLTLAGDPRVPVNTLDYPALEFEIARLGRRGIDAFRQRLLNSLSLQDVAAGLRPMPLDPAELALHADILLGDSRVTERWKNLASGAVERFDARFTQTRLDYLATVAKTSRTAENYRHYGAGLLTAGRYAESIEQFRTALAIDPKADNVYFDIGAAYEKSGKLEAALENYANELRVDPTDSDVPFREGRVCYKLKRYRQALGFLDAAVAQHEDADAQYYRGLTLEALGQLDQAAKAYARAVALDRDASEARLALQRLQAAGPR